MFTACPFTVEGALVLRLTWKQKTVEPPLATEGETSPAVLIDAKPVAVLHTAEEAAVLALTLT